MSLLTPPALARFRAAYAEPATAAAFPVGLALAAVHPLGLVAAGALLGLVAPSFRRALVTGVYFGGVVLAAFAVWLVLVGTFSEAAGLGRLTLLSVVVGLAVPPLAASVRGLV